MEKQAQNPAKIEFYMDRLNDEIEDLVSQLEAKWAAEKQAQN